MRRTLIIIKPDGINRALIGRIINRFEEKGLKIVGLKMDKLQVYKLKEHYAHLTNKPFFEELLGYMSGIPCILMAIEGKDAVSVVRRLVGETCGREALPGTIRGDFSMSTQTNLVHASENDEVAKYEIARFFKDEELFEYDKMNFNWIYCNSEKGMYTEIKDKGKSVEELEHARKKQAELDLKNKK
ncbi:MAG: nucleoside-diphosphate kinase [archaeon]